MPKFKRTFIYIGSNIVYQLPPLLLLPFLTHYLSQNEYGAVAFFTKTAALLLIFSSFGAKVGTKKDFYKYSTTEFSTYFGTNLLLPLLVLPFICLVLYLLRQPIAQFWGLPALYLWFIPLFVWGKNAYQLSANYFKSLKKPLHFALLKNAYAFLEVALAFVFIAYCHWGLLGRLASIVLATIAVTLPALFFLWQQGRLFWTFNQNMAITTIKTGLPILPVLLSVMAFKLIDTYLTGYLLGANAMGVYALALRISMAGTLLQSAILAAQEPALYEILAQPEKMEKNASKIVKHLLVAWFIFLLVPFLLSFIAVPLFFDLLIDKKFSAAIDLILPLSLSMAFLGISQSMAIFFIASNKHRYNNLSLIVAMLVLIIAAFIVAPIYGLVGMAWVTCLAYSVLFLLQLLQLPKLYSLPWKKGITEILAPIWQKKQDSATL